MSPKLSKKRKIINIKNKYHDVLSYMIDSYYENNNTIFTVKYISVNTGVNLSIIKDVLSLLDRTKIVTALPFKLSYKEVLKLEKIKEQYYSKTLSLVNIVIAVGAFLVTFGVGLFTIYNADLSLNISLIYYVLLFSVLSVVNYFIRRFL